MLVKLAKEATEERGGMANEWVGVVGTLAGGVLGAGATFLTQRAQWRRQDRLSKQAESTGAAEEFLRALQPCRRLLMSYLGILRQQGGDLDREKIDGLTQDLEISDGYREKFTYLESTIPKLEIYGSPEMARLGREIVATALSTPRTLSSFDRLDRQVRRLDALEESLQNEIHWGRHG
jgi:hypothetical protein